MSLWFRPENVWFAVNRKRLFVPYTSCIALLTRSSKQNICVNNFRILKPQAFQGNPPNISIPHEIPITGKSELRSKCSLIPSGHEWVDASCFTNGTIWTPLMETSSVPFGRSSVYLFSNRKRFSPYLSKWRCRLFYSMRGLAPSPAALISVNKRRYAKLLFWYDERSRTTKKDRYSQAGCGR